MLPRGLEGPRRASASAPRRDEQGLGGDAQRAVEVGEAEVARPAPPDVIAVSASRQTHSPTGSRCRWTVSSGLMNSQRLMSSSQRGAVAAVGSDEHALERRGLFVRHERVAHPHPHGGRPGNGDAADHWPPLHSGHVAVRPALRYLPARPIAAGGAPGSGGGTGWRDFHRGTGRPQHPPRRGPRDLTAARARGRLEQFDAAPRPRDPGGHGDLADRDGPQDLAGEPRDHHVRPRLAAQHRPAEQCARRPAVLRAGVPRPRRVHGRLPHAIANRNVEAVRHEPNLSRQLYRTG